MALTKRQKEILDFLKAFIDENGYSPSFEEICAAFGYTSLATVHEHLTNLATKGYIRKAPARAGRSSFRPRRSRPSRCRSWGRWPPGSRSRPSGTTSPWRSRGR